MAEKISKAEKEFAELEKKSMQSEAELKKTVEGLSSKNEVIDRQLTELKANYKQERQDLELKFSTEMKDYRAESEAKIKRLEHDIAAAMSKVGHEFWKYCYVCASDEKLVRFFAERSAESRYDQSYGSAQ
jgi:hypothetical protein